MLRLLRRRLVQPRRRINIPDTSGLRSTPDHSPWPRVAGTIHSLLHGSLRDRTDNHSPQALRLAIADGNYERAEDNHQKNSSSGTRRNWLPLPVTGMASKRAPTGRFWRVATCKFFPTRMGAATAAAYLKRSGVTIAVFGGVADPPA
jgi:hypothetical protein